MAEVADFSQSSGASNDLSNIIIDNDDDDVIIEDVDAESSPFVLADTRAKFQ
jgi:hypothetical protein